ncbi:metallo-beta-lactamase superfamily protein [Rutstroemia sp. NJR-2017a BVV2]|nr:metallo-beta-lactamase superfamily protein [Rutstroemia sp. NJR-2017a BVV2]
MSKPAPNLHIPPSPSTVRVQIINTTTQLTAIPFGLFVQPKIPTHTHLTCPSYSFLITHPTSPQKSVLFDLGVRPDWQNLPPSIVDPMKANNWGISAEKDVPTILSEQDIPLSSISAVIWSHHHFDHTGNPALFPPSTALVVGPGFKSAYLPGYPANQKSPILESDYAGRELREIEFDQQLKIGRFNAHDYFGDGSFYLLDAPGHTVGHLCALARISTAEEAGGKGNGDRYIFMSGDACHHGGQFRPSPYHPLPEEITPNPLHPNHPHPCPGAVFEKLLRDGDRTRPFYEVAKPENGSVANDAAEAQETIEKMIEVDASDEVLVIMAHDDTLLEIVDFFPKEVDAGKIEEWGEKGRWLFLKDFVGALDKGKE